MSIVSTSFDSHSRPKRFKISKNFSASPKIKGFKRKMKPKLATSHNFKIQKPKDSKNLQVNFYSDSA